MGVLFDTWKGTKLAQVPGLLRGDGKKKRKKESQMEEFIFKIPILSLSLIKYGHIPYSALYIILVPLSRLD